MLLNLAETKGVARNHTDKFTCTFISVCGVSNDLVVPKILAPTRAIANSWIWMVSKITTSFFSAHIFNWKIPMIYEELHFTILSHYTTDTCLLDATVRKLWTGLLLSITPATKKCIIYLFFIGRHFLEQNGNRWCNWSGLRWSINQWFLRSDFRSMRILKGRHGKVTNIRVTFLGGRTVTVPKLLKKKTRITGDRHRSLRYVWVIWLSTLIKTELIQLISTSSVSHRILTSVRIRSKMILLCLD